ncbi:DUF924 family protein [Sphingomicrobium astaxanthinifaciens]|uniref:DUF924 family protein n=1 Tax=Sphingomicrobium astaxanthinifaciens TaxID=1227949 RepID=UPI001FCB6D51|nr:DUF924 family protein [Sphingomicrobium astaxanthinifaciens]MCJ7422274.1 DUF924 domain-containing protein [Sphingomicrobium astaxanthinifaciens]
MAFAPIDSETRRQAQDVIDYWFDDVGPDRWWKKDPALDAEIRQKWGKLRQEVLKSEARVWREGPRRILAAIILLDQFSRNIHRGKAKAFEADALARRLTRRAIAKGWDQRMTMPQRRFLYMPLMHSEDLDDQAESVRLFDAMSAEGRDKFAHLHYQQIADFGRFPGRNKALGRESTPEERIALEGGAAF